MIEKFGQCAAYSVKDIKFRQQFACQSWRAPIKIALLDFAPYYAPDSTGEPIAGLVDKIDTCSP